MKGFILTEGKGNIILSSSGAITVNPEIVCSHRNLHIGELVYTLGKYLNAPNLVAVDGISYGCKYTLVEEYTDAIRTMVKKHGSMLLIEFSTSEPDADNDILVRTSNMVNTSRTKYLLDQLSDVTKWYNYDLRVYSDSTDFAKNIVVQEPIKNSVISLHVSLSKDILRDCLSFIKVYDMFITYIHGITEYLETCID